MVNEPKRFEIYLVSLDPTQGSKIKKTRPCLIISPNEINTNLRAVIIAPMTTTTKNYPTRVNTKLLGKTGQIVLDQIRTVDKSRLLKVLGKLKETDSIKVSDILIEMFSI
jgi:mRNA interferase MazF